METTIARIDSNGVFTTLELQEKPITNNSDQIFGNLVTDSLSGTDKITIYYEGDSTEYPFSKFLETAPSPVLSATIFSLSCTTITEDDPESLDTNAWISKKVMDIGYQSYSSDYNWRFYYQIDTTNWENLDSEVFSIYFYKSTTSNVFPNKINLTLKGNTYQFVATYNNGRYVGMPLVGHVAPLPLNERISKPIVSIGSGGTELTKLTESVDQVIYPSNYLDHIKISDDPYTPDNTYIQIMKSDLDNNLVEVGDQIVFNQSRDYDDAMTTRLYTKRAENSLYDASISYFRNDPQDFSFQAIFLKSNLDSPHNDINVLISKRSDSSGSGSDPVSTSRSGGFHLLQLVFNYIHTQQGYDCYVCDEALSETILPISWAQGPQYVSTINSATEILCSQLIESIYAKTIISNIQIIDNSDYYPIIKIGNTNYELSLQYAVSPASGGYDNVSFGTQKSSNLPVSYNFKNYNGDILFALNFLDNELTSISVTSNYNQDYAIIYSIDIIDLYTSTSTEFSSYRLTVNGVEYLSASGGGNNLYKLFPSSSDRLDITSDFISIIHSIDPFVGENKFVTSDGSYFKTNSDEYFLVK